MFEGWSDYFLLVGSAAGALIGLLFVVVTLTANRERSTVIVGARVYMSPVLLHFAFVLVLSAVALTPVLTRTGFGASCGAVALIGLAASAWVTASIRGPSVTATHWSDLWCYGVAPGVVYLVLAGVAVAVPAGATWGPMGLAAMVLALLLVSIRNAWDLVTWLAPREAPAEPGG